MSLITEDGTAKTNSESYITVVDADTFHSNRGNNLWETMSVTEKEQALRRATDFMIGTYRTKWKGCRVTAEQSLDWPRYNVTVEYPGAQCIFWPANLVPKEIANACAILAFEGASGDLAPAIKPAKSSVKVGPIAITYDGTKPVVTIYRAVEAMLRPFLAGNGAMTRVERA